LLFDAALTALPLPLPLTRRKNISEYAILAYVR
jgi:hypothetical protein